MPASRLCDLPPDGAKPPSNPWQRVQFGTSGVSILTSITNEEISALAGLAYGRDCLEVGSAWGYSAAMMALHGASSVTAVDFHKPCNSNCNAVDSQEAMRHHLEQLGVASRVTIVCADSRDALPALVAEGRRFGLVFVDADHSYDSVLHDVTWARRLTTAGGFIASHDYGPDGIGGVTQAVDEVFPGGPDLLVGTLHVKQERGGR